MYCFKVVKPLRWTHLWWIWKILIKLENQKVSVQVWGLFGIRTANLAGTQAICHTRRWVLPALLLSLRKVAGMAAPGSSPGLNSRGRKLHFAAGTLLCFLSKEKNSGVALLQSVVGQLRAGVVFYVFFFNVGSLLFVLLKVLLNFTLSGPSTFFFGISFCVFRATIKTKEIPAWENEVWCTRTQRWFDNIHELGRKTEDEVQHVITAGSATNSHCYLWQVTWYLGMLAPSRLRQVLQKYIH